MQPARAADNIRNARRQAMAEALEPRRLMSVGDVDSTFGTDGQVVIAFGTLAGAPRLTNVRDTVTLPDGSTLIAGRANQATGASSDTDAAVARINPDGTVDTG